METGHRGRRRDEAAERQGYRGRRDGAKNGTTGGSVRLLRLVNIID
jgi:hypothetical protein